MGRANIRVAWWMIGAGMTVGAVLGLWSFGGPVDPPPGFRAFDDLPRRLVRLGHIAAIALPVLNLLYVPWMGRSHWGSATRHAGCRLLLLGTVALPSLLMLETYTRAATEARIQSFVAQRRDARAAGRAAAVRADASGGPAGAAASGGSAP